MSRSLAEALALRSHDERMAALERWSLERSDSAEQEARELDRRAQELRSTAASAIASAAVEAERRREQLDEELARRVRERLVPIARSFGASPRQAAEEFRTVWRELSAECLATTGSPIHSAHVAWAFAEVLGVDAGNTSFLELVDMRLRGSLPPHRLAEDGATASEIQAALATAEVATSEAARAFGSNFEPGRWDAARSRASFRGSILALEAFNRRRDKERAEQAGEPERERAREQVLAAAAASAQALVASGGQRRSSFARLFGR